MDDTYISFCNQHIFYTKLRNSLTRKGAFHVCPSPVSSAICKVYLPPRYLSREATIMSTLSFHLFSSSDTPSHFQHCQQQSEDHFTSLKIIDEVLQRPCGKCAQHSGMQLNRSRLRLKRSFIQRVLFHTEESANILS